jgi:hypothetical protein
MVNDPKKIFLPLVAGKHGKSAKQSERRRNQANIRKCGLQAVRDETLGPWRRVQSKMKVSAEKRWETHFLRDEGKEKSIQDYLDRETAVARQRGQDAETGIMQEQEHMRNVENAQSTTTKPETTFEEMLNAIRYSLSDLAS